MTRIKGVGVQIHLIKFKRNGSILPLHLCWAFIDLVCLVCIESFTAQRFRLFLTLFLNRLKILAELEMPSPQLPSLLPHLIPS